MYECLVYIAFLSIYMDTNNFVINLQEDEADGSNCCFLFLFFFFILVDVIKWEIVENALAIYFNSYGSFFNSEFGIFLFFWFVSDFYFILSNILCLSICFFFYMSGL